MSPGVPPRAEAAVTVLVLPGLGGSGPDHWQSWLEGRHPGFRRVGQRDWDRPALPEWVDALEAAVAAAPGRVLLVAHSLACLLVAHWASGSTSGRTHGQTGGGSVGKVAAALLVAPPDVESAEHTPPETHGFAPVPRGPLPFRTVLVASRDDPYCAFDRACGFAAGWEADSVDAGAKGHINAAAGFGPWPEGEELLLRLMKDAAA